ncbi:MAG: hypothetical protein WCD16_06940 [Paracoccaceae bacterium]
MEFRFDDLTKIPDEPAVRMLARKSSKLQAQPGLPASASLPEMLQALLEQEALFDMLHMLAVALPPREAVWWACLAARDLVGHDNRQPPQPLAAAERWVFKPDARNREAARQAMELADIDDDTVFCAMAAVYADGTMGEGELAQAEAPPNAVPAAVFGMNMKSVSGLTDADEKHVETLIARALDIARGGNGRLDSAALEDTKGEM